jgi:hypothetical protein
VMCALQFVNDAALEWMGMEMMSRAGKWLVAIVVTVAAFGVSLWVCGRCYCHCG